VPTPSSKGRTILSTTSAGKTGYSPAKNELTSLFYTILKSLFKTDQRPKCRTENYNTSRMKAREIFMTLDLIIISWI
jgi:hypothetical protein